MRTTRTEATYAADVKRTGRQMYLVIPADIARKMELDVGMDVDVTIRRPNGESED